MVHLGVGGCPLTHFQLMPHLGEHADHQGATAVLHASQSSRAVQLSAGAMNSFRSGASSLLGDIERQISHNITGRYAAAHRLAMG